MRTTIALGLCCCLATVIVAESTNLPAKPTPNRVDIHYRFQESVVTLHEPVVVLFEVHNGLSQPITLTLGGMQDTQFFQFSMTTPDGQIIERLPRTEEAEMIIFDGHGKAVVAPGGDYEQRLLMNQWFQFKIPGTYSLTSKLNKDIDVSGDGTLPPESQTVQLLVNPRDPARLAKVCAELARQVAIAQDVEAAQEPARMLSYVDDPIAVPYLAQVLSSHKFTDQFAVPGLERIGNDDAVEVLLSALDDKFGDIADLARQALTRMEDHISNPALKETVRRALAPTPSD